MRSRPEAGRPARHGYGAAFGAVLLDPERQTPGGVVGPRGKAADKRFNVYRNNVTHGLVTALGEIFPAVARIVGEGNFRILARDFVRRHPPRSPLVFEYGHAFADFLHGFEPLRQLPYLADVARLERAWLDAYHAADAAPLAAGRIGAVAPEALALLRFTPHPAMRLIDSRFAIHTILVAHRFGPMPERIRADEAESVLVTRPGLHVMLHRLEPGQHAFLDALERKRTLQEAAGQALERCPSFDLARAIGVLIESGAFSGLSPAGSSGE